MSPRGARALKWLLAGAAVLAALVLGAMLLLPRLVDLPRVHVYIAQAATQALGRPVRFERLSISALPYPMVRLRGLEVADDPRFGPGPLLRVEEGRFRLRLLPLFAGRLELVELTLDRVHLRVIEDRGRLNLFALAIAPVTAPARSTTR